MKYLLALLCVLGLTHSHAQNLASLRGRILDGTNSDDPVIFANVQLYRATDTIPFSGSATDMDGNYYIPYIPAGRYDMVVSCVGYTSVRIANIVIKAGEIHEQDARFVEVERIEEILVTNYGFDETSSGLFFAHSKSAKKRRSRSRKLKITTQQNAAESPTYSDWKDFMWTSQMPRSTFSIDVDNASYTRIRKSLRDGITIDSQRVRIEEMINYFDYSYPQPTDNKLFAVHTDIGKCTWNPQTHLVRVAIRGAELPIITTAAQQSNLVFLVDVSGSMSHTLPLIKMGLTRAVKQLAPTDRIAIVVYAGAAGLVLPSTPVAQKQTILDAIDQLESGGSTAGGEGIKLAYQIAADNYLPNGNNRVILCTDGDFNVGVLNYNKLLKIIEKQSKKKFIYLTVCAVGNTNDYNDAMLETVSNAGNGNYFYLDNKDEAERVFVKKLTSNLHTVAKDVKLQIKFNKKSVLRYKLIGYNDRRLDNKDFRNDKKDAGDLGAGHTVTAFYEVELAPDYTASALAEILTVALRYKTPKGRKSTEFEQSFTPNAIQDNETMSADFKFAAGVICFGEYLRAPKRVEMLRFASELVESAIEAVGEENIEREEFLNLVESCQSKK